MFIIKVSLLLLIILTWSDLTWTNMFPLAGEGVLDTLKNGVKYSSVQWEILGFAVLFPFIRNYSNYKTANIIGFGLATLELSIFSLAYLAVFDIPQVETISYPFLVMTRIAHLGRFIVNLEAFFLLLWGIASIINFDIYLYLTAAIFAYTLRIWEFEPLLLAFSAITVLLALLPNNDMEATLFYRDKILLNFTLIVILVIPMMLWLIDTVRGSNEK